MTDDISAYCRILNVTDNHPEHLLLARLFRSECEAELQWAPTGIVALQDMRKRGASELPDVVVIPWVLPMLTSLEFLAAMKGDPSLADIPVIVFGNVPDSEVAELRQAGARAVLEQGTTLESLEAAVRRLWIVCRELNNPQSR